MDSFRQGLFLCVHCVVVFVVYYQQVFVQQYHRILWIMGTLLCIFRNIVVVSLVLNINQSLSNVALPFDFKCTLPSIVFLSILQDVNYQSLQLCSTIRHHHWLFSSNILSFFQWMLQYPQGFVICNRLLPLNHDPRGVSTGFYMVC